jgi:predicted PurR-regulated permease PerM
LTARSQAAFWLAALAAVIGFLWLFSAILLPFIMGMALAYILDPLADRLERAGMSRLWATITILIFSVIVFVISLLVIIPVLASQMAGFIDRLPAYVARLQELAGTLFQSRIAQFLGAGDLNSTVEDIVKEAAGWLGTLMASVFAGGRAILNVVSLFVITPVVAFYLLYDWDRMIAGIDDWMPRDHLETVRQIGRDIDKAMAGFIRGQGSVCLVLGLFYAISLTLVGLNFGFLIGSVAGLISFIPYVGSIVGFVLSVGVALVQFWPDWIWVVVVAGIFVVGQFFEGNILQPRLVGSSVGVHPVWLMFALFAFGSLFGFVGMLIAVPATAAIGVLVRFGIGQYMQSRIYAGSGGGGGDSSVGKG